MGHRPIKIRKPVAPPAHRMESDKDKDRYDRTQKHRCQKCHGEGWINRNMLDDPNMYPSDISIAECDWC